MPQFRIRSPRSFFLIYDTRPPQVLAGRTCAILPMVRLEESAILQRDSIPPSSVQKSGTFCRSSVENEANAVEWSTNVKFCPKSCHRQQFYRALDRLVQPSLISRARHSPSRIQFSRRGYNMNIYVVRGPLSPHDVWRALVYLLAIAHPRF